MTRHDDCDHTLTRRGLLNASIATGVGLATAPLMFAPVAMAQERQGRILVVLELSGGNDGLNTVVPYGDDAYYRLRPQIGIRKDRLRKLDDHIGLNAGTPSPLAQPPQAGRSPESGGICRLDGQRPSPAMCAGRS